MNLFFASSNNHKIKEIEAILIQFQNLSLGSLNILQLPEKIDIPETGVTFMENANIKASTTAKLMYEYALADDSGLEVKVLDNRPGIYSNRYVSGSDQDRCAKLLSELAQIPKTMRQARYVCAMSLACPNGEIIFTTQAYLNGWIGFNNAGHNGFGYDPIFCPNNDEKSIAELSDSAKNLISHRANALKEVILFLNGYHEVKQQ